MRRVARIATNLGPLVAVLGLSKIHASQIAAEPYDFTSSFRFGWALLLICIYWVTSYAAGVPDVPRSPRMAVVASSIAAGSGALVISVLQLVVGDALLPRFVVFGSAILLVPWYVLCVALATGGRYRSLERDVLVVVASTEEQEALRADLRRNPERASHLAATVLPEDVRPTPSEPLPLVALAAEAKGTVIVLAREAQLDEDIVAQAARLHEQGVRVRTLLAFYDEWLGKLPVAELEQVSLMFDIGDVHRVRYVRVKRMLDVALAVVGAVALLLATPVIVVGNRFGNRGPLLYRQMRVGRAGVEFEILKFRTMIEVASDAPTEWTAEDDPRIAPFGRVLRRTHLDELPQVVNILRGELSVVGPRPEQPHYVRELTDKLPFYRVRHLVRPGLTGWAQVKYGYAGDERDALQKLQYDFFYLRHQGIGLDLRVVGRTIRSVFGREGR